jgi:hypothetical protein
LKPLANYPFSPGIAAIRGSLMATRPAPGVTPVAITGATIRLEWLDDDAVTWHASPLTAVTNAAGDFTAIVRLAPAQTPRIDAAGKMSLRLFAKRAVGGEKFKEFSLLRGRVTDETYPWDELQ